MNTTKPLCILLALAVLAAPAHAKPTHKKPAAKKAAPAKPAPPAETSDAPDNVWKPDPALLSKLGPEQTFGPYAMRVPVGYTVKSQPMPSNKAQITGYQLLGPIRKDQTAPVIFLFVGVTMPGFTTGSMEQMLNANAFLNAQPNLVKTDTEYGEVGGLSTARQYYKYPLDKDSTHLIHGFHYAFSEGTTNALVGAMDAEPYNTDTLPLCEAAARTLRKVNP